MAANFPWNTAGCVITTSLAILCSPGEPIFSSGSSWFSFPSFHHYNHCFLNQDTIINFMRMSVALETVSHFVVSSPPPATPGLQSTSDFNDRNVPTQIALARRYTELVPTKYSVGLFGFCGPPGSPCGKERVKSAIVTITTTSVATAVSTDSKGQSGRPSDTNIGHTHQAHSGAGFSRRTPMHKRIFLPAMLLIGQLAIYVTM